MEELRSVIALLDHWQTLAGATLGGVFSLAVALLVAHQALRGEQRTAAFLLISDLGSLYAAALNIRKVAKDCRKLLLNGVLDAIRRTGHRMCVVWQLGACSYVEGDGTINESVEIPSGGVALPASIVFDKRVPLPEV